MPTDLAFPAFEVLADFRFEALFEALIGFKLNSVDLPVAMAMVVPMRVVGVHSGSDLINSPRSRGDALISYLRISDK